jgi:hypothetical protein
MLNFHKTKSKINNQNAIQYSGADPKLEKTESYQLRKVDY